MALKNKSLALFFTRGVSLKLWHDIGMLEREMAIYNELAKYFNKIYFFTYGDISELQYKKYLSKNIKIIPKKGILTNLFYQFFISYKNKEIIKKCSFIKSNQMDGTIACLIAKMINKDAQFILRTGYTLSLFKLKERKKIKYLIYSLIEKVLYKKCDTAFVTSKGDLDYIYKKYRIRKSKINIIPNYIDTSIFKPEKVKKKENTILFVGRLKEQKNMASFLQALEGTGIKIDIVGEGELKEELIELAKELGVKARFLGKVDNSKLPKIYNQYPVYVLPSFYEGMPKTLLEAMSCGTACIATNVEGSKEVIKNGETGLLSKPDPQSLRQAIKKLVKNKKLQERLGKKARKFIEDNYDLKKLIKKEIEIYETL